MALSVKKKGEKWKDTCEYILRVHILLPSLVEHYSIKGIKRLSKNKDGIEPEDENEAEVGAVARWFYIRNNIILS